jgi:Protein-L-isoaspartate carboxylmethyltransferase
MTSTIDIQPGEKVLEIGTGSGYQSAVISHLTDQSYTIEIIEPLGKRSAANYERLVAAGYPEFSNIHTKIADGYFGWAEAAPFDKIIVTCGIDHIPPPLLQQLKAGGIMVIPIGPPGRQHVLEVKKVSMRRQHDRHPARHLQRQDRQLRAVHQGRRRHLVAGGPPRQPRLREARPLGLDSKAVAKGRHGRKASLFQPS